MWFLQSLSARFGNCSRQGPRSQPYRGITLLEVMISIGVVGIGLLGVASLIPLAHFKATQGIEEDRKAQFGKRAFRDFFVLGADRPGTVLQVDPSTPFSILNPYWVHYTGTPAPYINLYSPLSGRLQRKIYCLDPIWVASPMPGNAPARPNGRFPADLSPLPPPLANIMPLRITLMSGRPEEVRPLLNPPGRLALNNVLTGDLRPFTAPTAPCGIMSLAQAEQVFRLQDDIVIEAPKSPTDLVRQSYIGNGMKALSSGSYSWMATLVPDDPILTDPLIPAEQLKPASNMYTLSVVIFHQRNLLLIPRQEAIAQVTFGLPNEPAESRNEPPSILAGAVKEVSVTQIAFPQTDKDDASVRDIRPGGWIALIQPTTSYMKWYRVQSVDQPDSDFDNNRILTLVGPDWHPKQLGGAAPQPMFAIFVKNVVAVYDKSVEIR